MNLLKLILVFLFLLISDQILAVGISVSGPSSAVMEAGTTTKTVRFYISYSPGGNPWTSSLHYKINGGNRIPSNFDGSNANNPSYVDISLTEGSHTITFEWMAYDYGNYEWYYADTETKNITINFKVFTKNNFGEGNIKVDGVTQISGFYKLTKGGSNIGLEALEQNFNGYYFIWNTSGTNNSKWDRIPYQSSGIFHSYNRATTYSVISSDNYTTLEAGLRKICGITFRNDHVDGSNGGTITVNGGTYSSPTSTFNIVEQNTITASAINHTTNYIKYYFQKWEDNSTQQTNKVFTVNAHDEIKAHFKGYPLFDDATRNLHFNTYNPRVTQNIILYWNEHPNVNVTQYQIWRTGKDENGNNLPVTLLTTVNRGTTSFTDAAYHIQPYNTGAQLQYDVRAYYQTEGTYSSTDWETVNGEYAGINKKADVDSLSTVEELLANSISNYPNPYNPTTTISYQIKEAGNVQITVYDALGRKVKE
ncbi:MAG: hypothetical protein KDC88_14825, partial [Ignavibacteriae bacterium]|nr:hypothetical protein [Ignavibacteriota bacterium]